MKPDGNLSGFDPFSRNNPTNSELKVARFSEMLREFYAEVCSENIIANVDWVEKISPIALGKLERQHSTSNHKTGFQNNNTYEREFEHLDWAKVISICTYVDDEIEKWDNLRAIKGLWNLNNKELFRIMDIVGFDYKSYFEREKRKLGSQRNIALKHDINRRQLSLILQDR